MVPTAAPVVVVGVGEPFRSDDGLGPRVVAALRGRLAPTVRRVERVGEPTALLDLWDGASLAVVVDAMRSGAAPGTLRRLEGDEVAAAALAERTTSTHGLSVRDAIELGRSLGRLPARLVVYLVEAGEVGPGSEVSPAVERGIAQAADRIAAELRGAAPGA